MVKVGSSNGVPELVADASFPLTMASEEHRQHTGLKWPRSFFP
jgi:hypothetical protein